MKSKLLLLPAVCVMMSGCGVDWFPAVSSTSSSSSNTDNSTLTAPTVKASLSPTNIASGDSSTLTLTILNKAGNPVQSSLGFAETLPTGVTATVANATQCGGNLAVSKGKLVFINGSLAAGTQNCALTANLTATATGSTAQSFVIKSSDFDSTQFTGGLVSGVTDLTLTVQPPVATPTLSATLSPTGITSGENSTLTLTLQNETSKAAHTGLGFTETIPAGVTATVGTASQCGGTLAVSGQTLTFTGGSLDAGTSTCPVTANLTATATGSAAQTFTITSANFTGLQGLTSGVTDQTLTVTPVPPVTPVTKPTLTAALDQAAFVDGSIAGLIFTITNTTGNPAQSGLEFTEGIPPELIATAGSTTCGGTVSINSGGNITFSGGALAVGKATCTVNASIGLRAINSVTSPVSFIVKSADLTSQSLTNGMSDQTVTVFRSAVTSQDSTVTVSNLVNAGASDALTFTVNTNSTHSTSVSATVELTGVDATGANVASTDKFFSFTVPTNPASQVATVTVNPSTPFAVPTADAGSVRFWRLLGVTVQ